jgi:transcriptional repressor NrdR
VYCPKCSSDDTKVLESRLSDGGRSVRRRRSCVKCNHRFTTYEKEEVVVFSIQKKDGRVEPYVRDKVFRSIQVACQKRPITYDQIDAMLLRVEKSVQESGERTVPSQRIGDLIMEALHDLDKVAYVRFASVYKDFQDPSEFMAEIKGLKHS